MAPPTWTTAEEREHIHAHFRDYVAACQQGKPAQGRWWHSFYLEWFVKFPTLKTLISSGDLPADATEGTLTDEQAAIFGNEITDKRKVRAILMEQCPVN